MNFLCESSIDEAELSTAGRSITITFADQVMLDRKTPVDFKQNNPEDKKRNRSYADPKLQVLLPLKLKSNVASSADMLIFIHPPKTGGTNINFITEALCKTKPGFKAKRFSAQRVEGQSSIKITDNWSGGLTAAIDALEKDYSCIKDVNFISGHFPFGLHNYINIESKYIVLIRNPIDRELSFTNFNFQRGCVNEKDAVEYLLTANIDNPQTRMLAGQQFMTGLCDESTLELAKLNIEKYFLLAGITEDTNLFIQILASIQQWGPIAISKPQVTGEKVIERLSEDLIQSLKDKHSYDIKLYEWVRERWNAWKEENILAYQSTENYSDTEKILCITADFATTKEYKMLSFAEIEEYNRYVPDGLVSVSQKYIPLLQMG